MKNVITYFVVIMIILFFSLVNSQKVWAEEFITPDWSSDKIIQKRGKGDNSALIIGFKSEIVAENRPEIIKTGTIRLWNDVDQISLGSNEIVTDYKLCRVYSWTMSNSEYNNQSCYADPAFRGYELNNRIGLMKFLNTIKEESEKVINFDEPFWLEQELAVQNEGSDPLTELKINDGIEWRLGDIVVTRLIESPHKILEKDKQKFTRYFARYVNIHPQVRRAIIDNNIIPSKIIIMRRSLEGNSIETLSFSPLEKAEIDFPLPRGLKSNLITQSQGDSHRARGLRKTIEALAGIANQPKAVCRIS